MSGSLEGLVLKLLVGFHHNGGSCHIFLDIELVTIGDRTIVLC